MSSIEILGFFVERKSWNTLKKEDLEEWAHYIGHCRNAHIAMWAQWKWWYLRDKFGNIYTDRVEAMEDYQGWDIFVPVKKIDIKTLAEESEKIYEEISDKMLKKCVTKIKKHNII